jgi:5-methylcytosine-specific restriction enzyme subunit McrC
VASRAAAAHGDNVHVIPRETFEWLETRCFRDDSDAPWLRPVRWRGRRAVQVTSFVGVIQPPKGSPIEVLPKVGKAIGGGAAEARKLLIEMLRCLPGFRHVKTDHANLLAAKMPMPEVFIAEFLLSVQAIVKRGLRGDYVLKEDNLFALRGKLLVVQQLRHNLLHTDRFYTAHDEFSTDRPEHRLLRAALGKVLAQTSTPDNQRLARELDFAFADIAPSRHPALDFSRVRRDRGMVYYDDALAWARLILSEHTPLTGAGQHEAPSLLFPMEAVFEAFVAEHLPRQLPRSFVLKSQVRSEYLIAHRQQRWFRLKPDLLVRDAHETRMVLDTKWKLLDAAQDNASDKYGLSEADFYQMHAYGHSYLRGAGELALVYPLTDTFKQPLEFSFLHTPRLRLWVLPFCLKERRLHLPPDVLTPQGH